jgi:hypothetical protein
VRTAERPTWQLAPAKIGGRGYGLAAFGTF